MKNSTKREEALERLHDEYRREQKEMEEDEWVRMQRTGGGAET
tara:strand:- start:441 stop:569 length:129 start_codon:yes stop_codon:yes gene_type:complete